MTILSPFTNDKPFIGFRNGFLGGTSLGRRFNPRSLFAAGEQGVWYDPSDLSTMFQDTAGTTPVTAAGQAVGLVLDKSGQRQPRHPGHGGGAADLSDCAGSSRH
jgi:hypothetical protein